MRELSAESRENILQFVGFDVPVVIVIEPTECFENFGARELFEVEIGDDVDELLEFDATCKRVDLFSVIASLVRTNHFLKGDERCERIEWFRDDLLSMSMAENICRAS